MIEKKVYTSWAFQDNEDEKAKMNREIYKEIHGKAVVKCVGHGYAHTKYEVIENKHNLSTKELALICDRGNLCFGYRKEGNLIIISTD